MKYLVLFIMLVLSANCVNAAGQPKLINGRYFMGGDAQCMQYTSVSDNMINCFTESGVDTGYRKAMTDQEISMYQFQVSQEAQRQDMAAQRRDMAAARAEAREQEQLNRQAQQRARDEESYDRALDSFRSSQRGSKTRYYDRGTGYSW